MDWRQAAATALALAASAAGTAAPPNPFVGSWQLVIPGSGCTETYAFRADGTLHTVSAGEETDVGYQVAALPDEPGAYLLRYTTRTSNGHPDCSGRITPVGAHPALYLAPLRGGYLLCFDPALERCLGPMRRGAP